MSFHKKELKNLMQGVAPAPENKIHFKLKIIDINDIN